MKPSTLIALAITIFVAHIVTADLSSDRVSDAWASYYKQYYEEHNGVDDRNSGYNAPSTSYDSPPASYDSPSYVTSYNSYKSTPFDLLKPQLDPETAVWRRTRLTYIINPYMTFLSFDTIISLFGYILINALIMGFGFN